MEYVIAAFAAIGAGFLVGAMVLASIKTNSLLKEIKNIPLLEERIKTLQETQWNLGGRVAVLEGTRQVARVKGEMKQEKDLA